MFGNVDYYISQELARMIAQWRGDNMDMTLNSLAYKLQQESAEQVETPQPGNPVRPLLQQVGNLLVKVGQRMQVETQNAPEACEIEVCA
jgi:hypothetical protein